MPGHDLSAWERQTDERLDRLEELARASEPLVNTTPLSEYLKLSKATVEALKESPE